MITFWINWFKIYVRIHFTCFLLVKIFPVWLAWYFLWTGATVITANTAIAAPVPAPLEAPHDFVQVFSLQ